MSAAAALTAGFLLTIELACVVAIAGRITTRICRPDDGWLERFVVGLVIGLGVVLGILQLAGMLDMLRRGPVLVAHLAVAGAVLSLVKKSDVTPRLRVRPTRAGILVALPGLFFAVLGIELGLNGPSQEPDTVQYHAPNAGAWLQTHNLWHLPFTVPGYFTNAYPSNGELAGLWLILPSHGDQLAYTVNVAFGLLAVLAAALVARELKGPAWCGAVAGLGVVLAPLSFQTQAHSMMTDLPAASGIMAGTALVLRAVRSPGERHWSLLAGLALGIGVGSKDTALAPAAGAIVLLALLLPRGARLRGVAAAAGGVAALAGFWWLRNLTATGNPIFPEGVRIGSLHLLDGARSPLTRYSTTLFDHLAHGRLRPLRAWARFARTLVGPAVVLSALGVLASVAALVARPRRLACFLVGGLAAACFLAYLVTPYTGGGPAGLDFLMASQLRYALPALLLGAAAAAAAAPRLTALVGGGALLFDAAKDLRAPGFRTDLHPSLSMVALAATVALIAVAAAMIPALSTPARNALATRTRSLRVGGALVASLAVLTVAARQVASAPTGASPIDIALQRGANPTGAVMIVGLTNVRTLMGAEFQHRLISPDNAGNHGSGAALKTSDLQQAVRRLRPGAIVIPAIPPSSVVTAKLPSGDATNGVVPASGVAPTAATPSAAVPPGYFPVGSVQGSTVYVPTN